MTVHDQRYTYEDVLASSLRAQWNLDDVLAPGQDLDFSRDFMPDALVGVDALTMLDPAQRRTLNQICGFQYLHYFGQVEELILPFVLDHARPMLDADDFRVRALLNFANEEAKHIHLFNRFKQAFLRGFPVRMMVVGPAEEFRRRVFTNHPLAVGLAVLMIEWMTQSHYLDSIRDDDRLDPLFKSLLRNHWIEEAQHAKIDTLIVEAISAGMTPQQIEVAFRQFLRILGYFDVSLKMQAELNLRVLGAAIGAIPADRDEICHSIHHASLWTYIGSGLTHRRFRETLAAITQSGAQRLDAIVSERSAGTVAERLRAAA